MSSIVYCDWANGDDSTGDGTYSKPYKTVSKASTNLSGGDEVRVSKSPANTSCSGTISFTKDSKTVTGSGTSFTTQLSAQDIIVDQDGWYWEVNSITNDTSLELAFTYSGNSRSGKTFQKVGVFDAGSISSSSTSFIYPAISGSSYYSRIKISGGWDLSTQTKNGVTFFKQSGTSRNGYGINSSNSYVDFENFGFFRFYYGTSINCAASSFKDIVTACSGSIGFYFTADSCDIVNCQSNGGYGTGSRGFYLAGRTDLKLKNCKSFGFDKGFDFFSCGQFQMTDCQSTYNNIGMYFTNSDGILMINDIVKNNYTYGCLSSRSFNINVLDSDVSNNGSSNSNFLRYINCSDALDPVYTISIEDSAYALLGQIWESGQTSYSNSEGVNGSSCFCMFPVNSILYMYPRFYFPVDSGTSYTVSFKLRKQTGFSGDIECALFQRGVIKTSWTDVEPTSEDTYESKSISISSENVKINGVVELRFRLRGNSKWVYLDDLSISKT